MPTLRAYVLLLAGVFTTTPAWAQCGPRAIIEGGLASEYQESAIASGLSGRGYSMRLFVNPDTRTWTVVLVKPDGSACIVDGGEDMEIAKPSPTGRDG